MFPVYLKPGLKFKLNSSIYTILKNESNESIQVVNENFNEICYFTYQEIVQDLASGNLKFEVKGRNTKPCDPNDIKTSYLFNDLESNPYKSTIIFRYKVIEPLLQIPCAIRKRKDIENHVESINKLAEFPLEFKERFGIEISKKLSVATIYRWLKFYIESDRDIRSLAPAYKNCGGKYKLRSNDKIQQFLEESITERYMHAQRITIKEVFYDVVNKITDYNEFTDNKLKYPSYPTIARKISTIPGYDLEVHRFGKRSADINYSPVGDGVKVMMPLERVEIDSTILDILIVDENGSEMGRPYIVAAIDKFTRYILGFSIGFGSVGWPEVMQCIHHMLSDKSYVKQKYPNINNEWTAFGLPKTLVIDNGKAFINTPMIDACLQLGFILQQCAPHTPEWKGSIERFFGTTNKELIHQMPGTTRSNPQQLSEDENPSKQACLRFSVLIKLIHKWAIDVYCQDYHKGVKGIPSKLWDRAKLDNPIAIPNNIDEIAICLGRVEYRKITRKGIELNYLKYNSESLNKLLRKFSIENDGINQKFKVKYNPLDLSEIFLYDYLINNCWLCVPSTDPQYTKGLTEWEHKEAIKRALNEVGRVDVEALAKAKVEIYKEIQENIGFPKKKKAKIKKQNMANEIQSTKNNLPENYLDIVSTDLSPQELHQKIHDSNSSLDVGTSFIDTDKNKTVVIPFDTIDNSGEKRKSTKKDRNQVNKDSTNNKPLIRTEISDTNHNVNNTNEELTEDDFKGFKIITNSGE